MKINDGADAPARLHRAIYTLTVRTPSTAMAEGVS